ncbi:MAG: hypothetical protein HC867_10160 [Bacteroidia bacterium]|nr:hypothetical protein [Bacteroidia bacterium]
MKKIDLAAIDSSTRPKKGTKGGKKETAKEEEEKKLPLKRKQRKEK